jgi:hypothetical protein
MVTMNGGVPCHDKVTSLPDTKLDWQVADFCQRGSRACWVELAAATHVGDGIDGHCVSNPSEGGKAYEAEMEHDKLGQRLNRENGGCCEIPIEWLVYTLNRLGLCWWRVAQRRSFMNRGHFEQFRTGFPLMRWSFHLQLMNTLIF